MKTLLVIFVLLFLVTPSSAQVLVEFQWSQPDSTMGNVVDGIPPMPTPPGSIAQYEIFIATPTDTIHYGFVPAVEPYTELMIESIAFELYVPSSIRVRAVDIRGTAGLISMWSDPFTVEPGPPGACTQPEPIRVYFGVDN